MFRPENASPYHSHRLCWVARTGLVASVIAVPLGIALRGYVLPAMARSVDLGLPASFLNVYRTGTALHAE